MAFIREVKRGENIYFYLVESYRDKETGKVKQRNLQYLGTKPPRGEYSGENVKYTAQEAVNRRLRKKNKREKTPEEKLDQASQKVTDGLVDIAILRLDGHIKKETLRPLAPDIYAWNEGINKMLLELEGTRVDSTKQK